MFARPDLQYRETGFPGQWNETVTPAPSCRSSIAGTDRTLAASESVARAVDLLMCTHMCARRSLLRNPLLIWPYWAAYTDRTFDTGFSYILVSIFVLRLISHVFAEYSIISNRNDEFFDELNILFSLAN